MPPATDAGWCVDCEPAALKGALYDRGRSRKSREPALWGRLAPRPLPPMKPGLSTRGTERFNLLSELPCRSVRTGFGHGPIQLLRDDAYSHGRARGPGSGPGCRHARSVRGQTNPSSSGMVFFSPGRVVVSSSPLSGGSASRGQAARAAGGGDQVVPSRSMAQQRITKRRARATTAILRRVRLLRQIRSKVSRIHGL